MSRALISPGARPPLQCHRQKWTLLVALGASGCLQSLQPLDRAAAMPPTADPSATPTTAILAAAPPIALSLDDDMAVTNDPCAKTNQDKTEILTVYCAKCHSGPAERAQGLPPWNFVLDDTRLISEQFTREQQPPQRYVIPGDPDRSILYVRTAILTDMPPQPTDLGTPRNPTPTLSDFSVLRDWIEHCAPGAPPRGSAPPPAPAADAGENEDDSNGKDGGAREGGTLTNAVQAP